MITKKQKGTQMKNFYFYKFDGGEIVHIKNSDFCFEEHCHADDFIFTAVIDGGVFLEKNGEKRLLKSGDIFGVQPFWGHSLASEGKAEILSVCVNKKIIYEFPPEDFSEFLNGLMNKIPDKIKLNKNFLQEEIFKIHEKNYGLQTSVQTAFERSRDRLADMLSSCPENEKNIDFYAKEIFVSKFYYIKKIKEISGLTPHKLIVQSRVRKAQKLLADGEGIADAAAFAGFYDQSHFNKYFKKIVGITPLEYINSLKIF
ncbi:MAG: AraC family transcriptional regulator [Muribaculaceae bacterium]|nr:AraC family transcriptional regulator [Muribaculaceae bacterium]MCM1439382.1 AraC family transcriptional regulator [Roseburia sp.]